MPITMDIFALPVCSGLVPRLVSLPSCPQPSQELALHPQCTLASSSFSLSSWFPWVSRLLSLRPTRSFVKLLRSPYPWPLRRPRPLQPPTPCKRESVHHTPWRAMADISQCQWHHDRDMRLHLHSCGSTGPRGYELYHGTSVDHHHARRRTSPKFRL